MRFGLIAFLFLFFTSLLLISYSIFFPVKNSLTEDVLFSVGRGENFHQIGDRLKDDGLIKHPLLFDFYVIVSGSRKNLKAGDYLLNPSMSIIKISKKIVSGDIAMQKFTVIEGWRAEDIAKEASSQLGLDGERIERIIENEQKESFEVMSGELIKHSLEGYLFPDTYYLSYDIDEKGLIESMLENFRLKIPQKEIDDSNKELSDIITMASIIEKEVKTLEDKKVVSGILWKRLEIGMPLQVDATIIYLTGKRSTKVSIEETRINSPYNTYVNKGLPPGPISNPGIDSIMAALYPTSTDFLYYLSKPNGETVFSVDFESHLINKNKYNEK